MRLYSFLFFILNLSTNSNAFDLDKLISYDFEICKPTGISQYKDKTELLEKIDSVYNFTKSKTIFNGQQVACAYHQISVHHFSSNNYAKAIDCSNKAIEIRKLPQFNDGMLWKSYRIIGRSYSEMENFIKAKEYFLKAEEYLSKSLLSNKHLEKKNKAIIQLDLCLQYQKIQDFDNSIAYCEMAHKNAKSEKLVNNTYENFVETLILSDNQKRINQALKLLSKDNLSFEIGDSLNSAIALALKGLAFRRMNENSKSINAYEEALKLLPKSNVERKFKYLNNKAAALFHNKEYQNAITTLTKAYGISRQLSGNRRYTTLYAANFENLGENYEMLGKYNIELLDTALKYYHKAIINYTNNFRNESVFLTISYNAENLYVYHPTELIRNLHYKARVGYKLYKATGNKLYLNTTHASYINLFKFQKDLYEQISSENSRLMQAETILPYIDSALNVAFEIKDDNYKNYMLELMELNKSSVLFQSINETNALKYAGISDSILEKEQDLKIRITHYKKMFHQLQEANDTLEAIIFKDMLNEEQSKYLIFIDRLEKDHLIYYKLKYQQNSIKLSQTQEQLDNKSALLEYFIGDSTIYVMTIQKNQVDFHQIEKPKDWENKVNDFIENIIYKQHDEKYTIQAYDFYQLLLEKPLACLNAGIKHLQIIPDAELNKIPFAAILTKPYQVPKDSKIKFTDLSYLANQFFISSGYSAKLLLEAQKEDKKLADSNYIAFLAEDEKAINPFCDQYVSTISSDFDGEIYKGINCNIDNFKANVNNYSIVNLIMHGCGKLGALTFNDGDLPATDIYNLNLSNNQLTYLTACETNVGTLQKGEGIMSLSRAFTYAGCPALISTLWSVHPESTCIITESFFKHLKAGRPIDVALWEAQKEYIKGVDSMGKIDTNITAHPYYWAGIIPIGKMKPISFKK